MLLLMALTRFTPQNSDKIFNLITITPWYYHTIQRYCIKVGFYPAESDSLAI